MNNFFPSLDWTLEGIFRNGMPHWMCIGNAWVILTFIITGIIIWLGYFQFRRINAKIMASHRGSDYFASEKVWRGFSHVFLWCGIKSLLQVVTLFYGVYWLLALDMIANAIAIVYTVYHFGRNLHLFVATEVPEEEAKMSKRDLHALITQLRLEKTALKFKK